MRTLIPQLERYLQDALGIVVEPARWGDATCLPFFLQDRAEAALAEMLGGWRGKRAGPFQELA